MRIATIIPARKGSKGVPGKNKKVIAGSPLISYTLRAACGSKKLSDIYVSSDDDETLELASQFGVHLHRRPPALSSDESPVGEAVLDILRSSSHAIDAVLLLQPTSPLRTSIDIDKAISILESDADARSVISVVPVNDMHPARMYRLDANNYMESFLSEFEHSRRQDIPNAYYRNGCIYLTRASAFYESHSMINHPTRPYIMDTEWLLNIDTPRDVVVAEVLIPMWERHSKS